jgi:uncharacterized membrane protein
LVLNRSNPLQTELRPTSRRLEEFSDGVFAIAVTIMVVGIKVPDQLAFGSDWTPMFALATVLGTYALSFLVITNLWTSHHYLIFTVKNPSRSTIWLNNLLLFFVTLFPIATRFLGRHPLSSRAAAAYGLVGVFCTAAFMLLRAHAARLTRNQLHQIIHRRVLRRAWVFLAIYGASVGLAFVNPWLAWTCFIVVSAMLFLPIIGVGDPQGLSPGEHRGAEHSCP